MIMAQGKFKIEPGAFIGLDVALGEYAYIVQGEGDQRDQVTVDRKQAAQLADLLAAWAHHATAHPTAPQGVSTEERT